MLSTLFSYLSKRSPVDLLRDVVDVLVVYYVFYRLLLVARGTRAMQVAAGLAIIFVVHLVADASGLATLSTLVGAVSQSIILVVVVVFQNDIRRALQRVGSRATWSLGRAQETEVVDEVVEAARELARHRIGAIIAFEQDANLDEFVGQNKGIDIDAKVTSELLVSLFIPEGSNKLHDGAVILRSLRIARAGVFFPMPEGRVFDSSFGSRHRAAIGITEETDAVVVVVSEERGTISFCFNGNIAADLKDSELKQMLLSIMNPKLVRKASRRPRAAEPAIAVAAEPKPERISIKSVPPPALEDDEAPYSDRGTPEPSVVPPPLRKSALPPEPFVPRPPDSSPSATLPILASPARPMPKAPERAPRGDGDPDDTTRPPEVES